MAKTIRNLETRLRQAVIVYWQTRSRQQSKQARGGRADQGARSAVTGGAQMDGFIRLITDLIMETGAEPEHIFHNRALELPGYFRPTKQWDLLVVKGNQLLVAIEAKSQVGPSFGNNFNNRTEEAMGSAVDLWTAFREGAFNTTIKPWLGYLFLLDTCSCWRILSIRRDRSKPGNLISRCSRSLKTPPMQDAMSSSAGSLCERDTIRRLHFSCPPEKEASKDSMPNPPKTLHLASGQSLSQLKSPFTGKLNEQTDCTIGSATDATCSDSGRCTKDGIPPEQFYPSCRHITTLLES